MGKSTDLKLTKKKIKEVHETEKYELDDGSTITFYPLFPHTLIRQLFADLQNTLSTKPIEIEFTNELSKTFIEFYMIKYFTHFKSQLKATEFEEVLNEIDALIDLRADGKSAFSFIINEIFMPQEMKNVFDYAIEHIAQYAYLGKLEQQVQEEVSKLDLKNRDILESVFKKQQMKTENNTVQ